MQFYIYNNGPQGPFTREELMGMNITEDTPVWYEGLEDWMPASVAPETASLFRGISVEDLAPRPNHEPQQNENTGQQPNELPYSQQPMEQPQGQFQGQPMFGPQTGSFQGPQPQFPHQPQQVHYVPTGQSPVKRPKSYLTASIIVTILFSIIGIVAVVYASRTRSAIKYGDFTEADRLSQRSQLWIIISIVVGLVVGYFQFMYLMGSSLGGMA